MITRLGGIALALGGYALVAFGVYRIMKDT